MDSVPSSISFAELASYLNQNPQPGDSDSVNSDFNQQELELIAEDAISGAIEIVPDPMIHKVMALKIIARFVAWHNRYGERILALEGPTSAAAIDWFNDAGILKAAGMLMAQVSISSSDFTSTDGEQEGAGV